MEKDLCGKNRSYIVASYCHSVIQEDDEDLDHIIDLLKENFVRYRYKKKISYNNCCHTFTTAKFDADNGDHISKNGLSLRYLIDIETLDKQKMKEFIIENGWSDMKGNILYPGWNMPCSKVYNLKKRLGIEGQKGYLSHVKEEKKKIPEEETLMKRNVNEESQDQHSKNDNIVIDKGSIVKMMNKYFDREQYHNQEYEKMIKGKKRSENKEFKSATKKDKECLEG